MSINIRSTANIDNWVISNNHLLVVFVFTCLRHKILRLFIVAKVTCKCKVFEWQVFLILMCAYTILHTLSNSTSCSITPGGKVNINFLYLAHNNLMNDLLELIQGLNLPLTCCSFWKRHTNLKIYFFKFWYFKC